MHLFVYFDILIGMETTNNKDNSVQEKEEGFADFLSVVDTNEFTDSSAKKSDTFEDDTEAKNNDESGSAVQKTLYIYIGIFAFSSLGALLSHVVPFFAFTIYFWYLAFGLSLLSIVVLFFTGIFQGFSGKSFNMVGFSILFLVVLGVVGAGTCFINMAAANY
jgi:cation transport ATPase